jgi:hypothetical protein
MTHPQRFIVSLIFALPLTAGDLPKVDWSNVCNSSRGHDLLLTTADGSKVEGACVSVDVSEVSIRTSDHKVVRIARSTLTKIQMQRQRGHQLRSLGRGMHHALRDGLGALFSPYAPAGLVMVPATLAWGAISTPFCILGDIGAKLAGSQEIQLQ